MQGSSGSGKTYTLEGANGPKGEAGMIEMLIHALCNLLSEMVMCEQREAKPGRKIYLAPRTSCSCAKDASGWLEAGIASRAQQSRSGSEQGTSSRSWTTLASVGLPMSFLIATSTHNSTRRCQTVAAFPSLVSSETEDGCDKQTADPLRLPGEGAGGGNR